MKNYTGMTTAAMEKRISRIEISKAPRLPNPDVGLSIDGEVLEPGDPDNASWDQPHLRGLPRIINFKMVVPEPETGKDVPCPSYSFEPDSELEE